MSLQSVHILAIHAHPDDIEIQAGGTMAYLASQGHRLTFVTMTPGDCGSMEYGPEEIATIRRNEARTAARHVGAAYQCAEFRDLAIFSDDASRRRVTELIRSVNPDIVITSAPHDYHCDHEATSALVRDACFAVSCPNYRTGLEAQAAPAMKGIPHLYFMDPEEGKNRDGSILKPDFATNVTEHMDLKRQMLAAHASQRNWLLQQHGIDDYILTMERWSAERGQQMGVPFAEGFKQYIGHPYPATPLLQQLLADILVPVP